MKSSRSLVSAFRILAGAFILVLLSGQPVRARPWSSEPQPLLHRREPIRADAGSPLAWDRSGRILWFVERGALQCAYWTGSTFKTHGFWRVHPKVEAGLAVDAGWHFLYCVDEDGLPQCVHRVGQTWVSEQIGDEPLTQLLGVDALSHSLFGYDAQAKGIRLYAYDVKTKSWSSSIIASGLGAAGDAAAIDSTRHIVYSTHETVKAHVPRHPKAQRIGDPTRIGAFKPWPLVATEWDGARWSSRVIDETGVPQQPAVRATDHVVFYARRDEGNRVHSFRPTTDHQHEFLGSIAGWSGVDTYVDDDRYKIRAPQYPDNWTSGGATFGIFIMESLISVTNISSQVALKGPITVVPYYAPVWTETAVPARLAHFRALVNPKQAQLVQHRESYKGEVVQEQTGMQLAGYLYRDANGVLATNGSSRDSSYWIVSSADVGDVHSYPALGGSFDPANPPADFATLADPGVLFFAEKTNTTAFSATGIPTYYSTDASAPFVPAHLRLPTAVQLRTFGHDYLSTAARQPGARYQHYRNYGTDYALPSAIAVDTATGVTFYTQAPPPADDQDTLPYKEEHTTPPLAAFRPLPDPKLARPKWSSVWIVMVYDAARAVVPQRVPSAPPVRAIDGGITESRSSGEAHRADTFDRETRLRD